MDSIGKGISLLCSYYKEKQEKFQEGLDKKKEALKNEVELTAPKAFKLHNSKPRKRAVKRNYLDARSKSVPGRKKKIDWKKEPEIMPEMTKKYEQLVRHNKEKRFLEHNKMVQNTLWDQEKKRRRKEVISYDK